MPNVVAGIVFGQRFLKNKLGLMIADNFQNQYYGSNSIFNQVAPDVHAGGAAIVSDYANRYFSTQELNNGLTLHLDYQFNDKNKILLTNMALYTYIAQARDIIDTSILGGNGGRTVPGTGPVSTDYTSVTSKQILENLKLEGRHILSKHILFDWTGVFSYAAKRSPDMADLAINSKIDTMHTTHDINGPYVFVKTPNYFDEISRIWQHNEDMDLDGIFNLAYRGKVASKGSFEFKMGGLYRHKTRSNIQDEYDLKPTTSSSGIKQQFTDIYSAQWIVYNSSGTYDYDKNKYKLHEDVAAGYGQVRFSFPAVDVAGGLRVENTKQGYKLNTFYATGINGVDKNYTDLLPSIDIKYKLNGLTNFRASYYKAIARPNFYDLVPATRQSTTTANSTTGNPYLNHTVSDNYDLRYEFYPHEEDQVFAGVFYKKIINPIETVYESGTNQEPQNLGNATDYGAELAWTYYFGRIGITGNYTYIYSKIYSTKSYYDLNTGYINTDTLQKRSLQGQTDHTLNISLLYRSKMKNFFAELAFQYLGRSIALVYPIYGYDYYQQPQYNLAFSAEKELKNRHFTLFTKINNILNTPTKNEINSLLVVSDVTKFNFSFGIRYEK
ncbi:MAG TPA: TonB-dependent receptor [Puia sp.]|nr:TonB-dependent receptor [Puia sp.]